MLDAEDERVVKPMCRASRSHGQLRHSWNRFAGVFRLALPALIVLLSVVGFLVANATIRGDRDAAAERRSQLQSVRVQSLLGRARAYVAGLGNVLASEPVPAQRRFAQLVADTTGGVGLVDALWVQNVGGMERATFATRTRPELRPGVDVSAWPALGSAISDRGSAFALSASGVGSLGGQAGFYLLQAGRFGRGPDSQGTLVVFVPQGWLTLSLEDDPRHMAISLDGRRLEGLLDAAPVAGASFDSLARRWRIDAGRQPASGFQSVLPWVALAWPLVASLLVFLIAGGIRRRRRAEREVERIFDLSLDLLAIAGFDGYFRRVNPAFERTLGYTTEELLSRPFFDLVHPEDRERTIEAMGVLAHGEEIAEFENRYLCRDGSVRWLQWNTRPAPSMVFPDERLLYAAARDVTERRRAEEELREAQRTVEASRDELRVLAEEQAALRRVATLVAQGSSSTAVFHAVTGEIERLLGADAGRLMRYEPDGTAVVVATRGSPGVEIPVGTRLTLEGTNVPGLVLRSGRAARVDSFDDAPGSIAARSRRLGVRAGVGAPVVVEGRLWGVMVAAWTRAEPVSPDAEERLIQFTELVATAIANAESRAELTASRARVVAAADETRRRIERDLHDGTQQRLVSLALALRAAEDKVPPELGQLRAELAQTASGLAGAVEDLQEIARGIHPAILSRGGLGPALRTLARRASLPVELDVDADRKLPDRVQVAAYFIVSEAITNAAKHARASVVQVELEAEDSLVRLAIRDDGVGGADPARGSGLVGLRDRVEALGGTIEIASGPGRGTSLKVRIPIGDGAPPGR
jgi:PAS domain S-box-containing protein